MALELNECKESLVVDHEDIGDIVIPSQKLKVATLKDARRILLEQEFDSIVFLSVLEEANEIEVFVGGLRSHPKLESLPIFCEFALNLALPKELGLIAFEESALEIDEEEDESDAIVDFSEMEEGHEPVSSENKTELIDELMDLSAKSLVRLELMEEKFTSKKELINQYIQILRQELE